MFSACGAGQSKQSLGQRETPGMHLRSALRGRTEWCLQVNACDGESTRPCTCECCASVRHLLMGHACKRAGGWPARDCTVGGAARGAAGGGAPAGAAWVGGGVLAGGPAAGRAAAQAAAQPPGRPAAPARRARKEVGSATEAERRRGQQRTCL